MRTWQAAEARHRFGDLVDAAVAGEPQSVERRDGKKVVLVSREYFDSTRPNLRTFLLNQGYSGAGEDQFDRILQEVRRDFPDLLSPRAEE